MKCPQSLDGLRQSISELDLDLPVSDNTGVLADTVSIGKWTSPNRFVALPMEGCDALPDGSPGELTFRRYEKMAAGGAGIIWMEACAVVNEGRSKPTALYLNSSNVECFRKLVDRVRNAAKETMDHEIICILQITHSGRYCRPHGDPAPVMVRHCPDLDSHENLPDDFPVTSDDELDRIQKAFIESAALAQEAGFDGVDIKACHGYLVSSLLGAHEREGKYGGSYENRTRFLRETIARVQERLPSLLVTTRLNIFDGVPYPYGFGVSEDDAWQPDMTEPLRLVGELRDMGLTLLSVSIGFPRFDPHFGRPSADAEHEHPLIGIERFSTLTGRIQTAIPGVPVINAALAWLESLFPHVAAGLVERGSASLIGQGRNSLAYPDSVRDILETGKCADKRCCVACSGCSKLLKAGKHVGCIVRDREVYSLS